MFKLKDSVLLSESQFGIAQSELSQLGIPSHAMLTVSHYQKAPKLSLD